MITFTCYWMPSGWKPSVGRKSERARERERASERNSASELPSNCPPTRSLSLASVRHGIFFPLLICPPPLPLHHGPFSTDKALFAVAIATALSRICARLDKEPRCLLRPAVCVPPLRTKQASHSRREARSVPLALPARLHGPDYLLNKCMCVSLPTLMPPALCLEKV